MSKPVTRERIDQAIAWYRENKAVIASNLPISTPGVKFKSGWPVSLERQIAIWESGDYSLPLAATYVHRPIVLVARGMRASVSAKKVDAP